MWKPRLGGISSGGGLFVLWKWAVRIKRFRINNAYILNRLVI